MLALLFGALQLWSADTLKIGWLASPPRVDEIDRRSLGPPQVLLPTRQDTAQIWVVRSNDTVFIAARIPDTSHSWGDDFVVSLDTRGDGAPRPEHDDFQFYFRRVLDSSVVFRGRNGRWQPPRDDPHWRLRTERQGGGWEISAGDTRAGWSLLLRLAPDWFVGDGGRLPRLAFRIYDGEPGGWFAWPPPQERAPATTVEQAPSHWAPVTSTARKASSAGGHRDGP
jgi:hypothetical protein